MILLPLQFIARADDTTALIAGIIFGVLILLIFLSARRGPSGSSGKGSKYNKGNFKKKARSRNLENHHIQLLQKAIKDQQVASPMRIFESAGYLNKTLQGVITSLENSNMDQGQKNQIIAEIFEIKRRMAGAGGDNSKKLGHSRNLKLGQPLTVYSKTLPPAQTRITGNLESHLAIETPISADGSPMKYRPGAPLKVRFIRDSGKVYVFVTKLREYRKVDGIDNMLVDHSAKVEQNQLRKSPRREFNKPAYFQRVEIVTQGTGRKAVKRAVVNKNRRYLGQIEDISRGGCALYSRNPMKKGSLIKMRFDISGGEELAVFGKVKNVEPTKPFGGLMHVAFTRVSTRHLNEIQSYVYGFFEE